MQIDQEFLQVFMTHSPKSFFHVDWMGKVKPKTFIQRTKLDCNKNPAINPFAVSIDLESLTHFGEKHLWGDRTEWATACRELMCEWIRRERYKDEISRLHCLFGTETLDEAMHFAERHKIETPSIWIVQAIDFSGKKDMNWFDKPGTLMEKLYYADCYWQGLPADDTPLWEVLLYPSIYIDERVQ
jgi:hypothetical protein